MILPTKHVTVNHSMLGVGALILTHLEEPSTVSSLWEKVRTRAEISTYERFTLGLDLLFIVQVVDMNDGKLRKLKT